MKTAISKQDLPQSTSEVGRLAIALFTGLFQTGVAVAVPRSKRVNAAEMLKSFMLQLSSSFLREDAVENL